MIGATVDVRRGWSTDIAKRVNRLIPPKLERASERGADVAAAKSQSRKETGLMATMEVLDVEPTGDGWVGGFRSLAWYARLHSKGYTTGGTTVPALRFLEAGRTVARRELVDELNRL